MGPGASVEGPGTFHAMAGLARAGASVRAGALAGSEALGGAPRPRECRVVLVGARVTTWAAAILAAPASQPSRVPETAAGA